MIAKNFKNRFNLLNLKNPQEQLKYRWTRYVSLDKVVKNYAGFSLLKSENNNNGKKLIIDQPYLVFKPKTDTQLILIFLILYYESKMS